MLSYLLPIIAKSLRHEEGMSLNFKNEHRPRRLIQMGHGFAAKLIPVAPNPHSLRSWGPVSSPIPIFMTVNTVTFSENRGTIYLWPDAYLLIK